MSVAINNDGTEVASASRDGTARLWRIGVEGQLRSLRRHSDRVNNAGFLSNSRLFSVGADGHIILWQINDNEPLDDQAAYPGSIALAIASPKGDRILTMGSTSVEENRVLSAKDYRFQGVGDWNRFEVDL